MKKLLQRLMLAALMAPLAQAALAVSSGIDYSFKKPEDLNRNLSENSELFGFYTSTESAAGVVTANGQDTSRAAAVKQWATGQGVLEDVVYSTAAATTYVVCVDTDNRTGATTDLRDAGNQFLIPPTFANTTQSGHIYSTATSGSGRMAPVAYRVGVACWTNATELIYWPVLRQKGD